MSIAAQSDEQMAAKNSTDNPPDWWLEEEKAFSRSEDLHPELEDHIVPIQDGAVKLLTHPFVLGLPYLPAHNALYNLQLKRGKSEAQRLMDAEDFASYVFLHRTPYLFQAFMEIEDLLSDADYWTLLGDVYTGSEDTSDWDDCVEQLFSDERETESAS